MLAYRVPQRKETLKVLWLVAAVVLLHFTLVDISDYPLTLAPFVVVWFMFVSYQFRFPKIILPLWSLLLILPFLNFDFAASAADVTEFMQTYLLWVFAATVVLFACSAGIRADSLWVGKAAFVSLVIVALYSVAQYGLYKYLGLDILYNPWGNHQYAYQYDLVANALNLRPQGFYLEPSYDAFVITSMLFISVISNYRPIPALVLGGGALLVIQALSGVLVYSFILGGYLVYRATKGQVVAGAAVFLFCISVGYLSGVGEYFLGRIVSIPVEGSSAYYRIVAPLGMLRDILTNHLTGLPFGSYEKVVVSYGLLLEGMGIGHTLDNGLYVLLFYFGWIGIIVLPLAALAAVFLYRGRMRASTPFVLGYLFLSLFYSGAIFNPEYVLIVILTIYVWRTNGIPVHARGDAPTIASGAGHGVAMRRKALQGGGSEAT